MIWLNPTYDSFNYLIVSGTSFLLVFMVIPSIIYVANQRQLFDIREAERKTHIYGISRLGGIAVFASLIISTLFFSNLGGSQFSNYIIISYTLLFSVGLKDDLWGVNTSTKFFIQLIVALIIVLLADIRLSSFHGVFNLYEVPYWGSVILSVLVIILITNAFNLIDGIDGLLGVISIIVSLSFGILFVYMHQSQFAAMAFIMFGASVGFLSFNVSPAKIFMGDAGSLLWGFMASILSIKFIELNSPLVPNHLNIVSSPAIAMTILIVPLFDTLRVFVLRIIKKRSPFIGDNNHIHHRFLLLGLSHMQTTFVLTCLNIFAILLVLYYQDLGNDLIIVLLFGICIIFNLVLSFLINLFTHKSVSLQNS